MLLTLHDVQAQYAPEYGLLRLQWRRPAATSRFKLSMNSIAQLLESGTVSLLLFDLHGLPSLGLDEQFWMAADWMARASVPAIRKSALVLPGTDFYNQMVVESLLRAGQHFVHYDVQFFGTTVEALDWLLGQHNPAAQPALEQEWTTAWTAPPEEQA